MSAVKLHRAPERRKRGLFLAEGANAVIAALESRPDAHPDSAVQPTGTGACTEIFYAASAAGRPGIHDALARAQACGIPVRQVTERAAARLSETVTPQGIVAVCRLLDVGLDEALGPATPGLVAVPVGVADPGNAGTIVRIADAMGARAVVLAGDSVDPHNGKCVRSSAGSVFHVPIARRRDTAGALAELRDRGVRILATAADGEVDVDDADDILAGPTAWLFGNEAHGLAPGDAAAADHRVRIPIGGRAESLNLATAAAICLHASARAQRRAGTRG
ncbi:TrmH family RNA methyltransferase [Tomitella fengzijianii]|uniref:TrmH family RNA methyltransferase n=1 Tax=Tomitella fengzijianii TaxID=2597660 RepID=UPI001E4D8E03|nr:RNA methyltransferase [Tomitella fengzijianii]